MINPRTLPDVQIRDADLHKKRFFHLRICSLRFIHDLTIGIEHLIAQILVCALLRVIQNLISESRIYESF